MLSVNGKQNLMKVLSESIQRDMARPDGLSQQSFTFDLWERDTEQRLSGFKTKRLLDRLYEVVRI
jgi:hypothetical protein